MPKTGSEPETARAPPVIVGGLAKVPEWPMTAGALSKGLV
jgi:hypothetical protein